MRNCSIFLIYFLRLITIRVALAIWPIPDTISTGQEILLLSRDFTISPRLSTTPQDLIDAIDRTRSRLFNDNLGRLTVDRGSSDGAKISSVKTLRCLRLSLTDEDESLVRSISDQAVAPLDSRNEGYSLNVPADGRDATLEAATTLGLLRGLTTFEQLWYTYSGQVYAVETPLRVMDSPAYVRTRVH